MAIKRFTENLKFVIKRAARNAYIRTHWQELSEAGDYIRTQGDAAGKETNQRRSRDSGRADGALTVLDKLNLLLP